MSFYIAAIWTTLLAVYVVIRQWQFDRAERRESYRLDLASARVLRPNRRREGGTRVL